MSGHKSIGEVALDEFIMSDSDDNKARYGKFICPLIIVVAQNGLNKM